MKQKERHSEMALEKVHMRAAQTSLERPDFIHHLLQAFKAGNIKCDEMFHQSTVLILAGSEISWFPFV